MPHIRQCPFVPNNIEQKNKKKLFCTIAILQRQVQINILCGWKTAPNLLLLPEALINRLLFLIITHVTFTFLVTFLCLKLSLIIYFFFVKVSEEMYCKVKCFVPVSLCVLSKLYDVLYSRIFYVQYNTILLCVIFDVFFDLLFYTKILLLLQAHRVSRLVSDNFSKINKYLVNRKNEL